jgi:hypothetical protein
MDAATTNAQPRNVGPRVIHAPAGYLFMKGRGTMLVRTRGKADGIRDQIFAQLKRCGWPTRTLKVRAFGERFFVNIGFLRGLDPAALYEVLRALPNQCGHKKVLAAIEKLPEQVETDISIADFRPAVAQSKAEGVPA